MTEKSIQCDYRYVQYYLLWIACTSSQNLLDVSVVEGISALRRHDRRLRPVDVVKGKYVP